MSHSGRSKATVVGAGFAGAVTARRLADAGIAVTVVERRGHVGGNAYDRFDSHGVLVHEYGPHIFHTKSRVVLEFLSRFTEWRFYEHRVRAQIGDQLLPLPINRTTLSSLVGETLSEEDCRRFLDAQKVDRSHFRTSEDVVLAAVGPALAELFFSGYTRKQWGRGLDELDAGVAARIPTRVTDDDRYFEDPYQFMPADGYTAMFERMLSHDLIEVRLGESFERAVRKNEGDVLVYTGPIDEFFGYRFGRLPYRSLRFEHQHYPDALLQPVGTINYPNDHAYTRQTEFKHLTGQRISGTSVVREFPTDEGDPYYPVPCVSSRDLHRKYAELGRECDQVYFVGRLAQYRYYNMDQVVAAALHTADEIVKRCGQVVAVRQQAVEIERLVSQLRRSYAEVKAPPDRATAVKDSIK